MVQYFKEKKLESKAIAVEEVVIEKQIVKKTTTDKKQNKHDKKETFLSVKVFS